MTLDLSILGIGAVFFLSSSHFTNSRRAHLDATETQDYSIWDPEGEVRIEHPQNNTYTNQIDDLLWQWFYRFVMGSIFYGNETAFC